jgi:transglutaminase-like putative cysteine protease
MICKYCWILICCILNVSFAQKSNSDLNIISEKLLENANSIILNQEIAINVKSQKSYLIKKYKKIKVLNKLGIKNIDALEYYDKSSKINFIKAMVYDSNGSKIKKFDKSDFTDISVADGFSVFTDNRVLYLNFTPTEFPLIIEFESQVENSNTAFIPSWMPIDDFFESVLQSSFTISYPADLGFKFQENNWEGFSIQSNKILGSCSYNASNLVAIKSEEYSPSFVGIVPIAYFGFDKFNLEGVDGFATSWMDFGMWINNNLLSGTDDISDATKQKMIDLVGNTTDPIEKAKIIYGYVQNKVRYVSIQLGIGGWKPMNAADVDRLGYGDCKALSNYTKSLLNAVNVPSFYTLIYGDSTKKDIKNNFVSMQGNHAILTIPNQGKYYSLECTSQTAPFGFNGDFTDDRMALIVTQDGGQIIKTSDYNEKKSTQIETGFLTVDEAGNLKAQLKIVSDGTQYNDRYFLENATTKIVTDYYKSFLSEINNLKIEKVNFINNKNNFQFTENLDISATNYASFSGNLIMFPINAFNRYASVPQRYRNRSNPFEIQRGFYDQDEIIINLPNNYVLDGKPEDVTISTKFGEYNVGIEILSDSKLKYKRSLLIKKGNFEKEEYDVFRKFIEQVVKLDASKILLTKKT